MDKEHLRDTIFDVNKRKLIKINLTDFKVDNNINNDYKIVDNFMGTDSKFRKKIINDILL